MNLGAREGDSLGIDEMPVTLPRMGELPQSVVTRVHQHRGVQALPQLRGEGDVVVVAVHADDCGDVAIAHGFHDRFRVVRRVHYDRFVADHPHIVVDIPSVAVEFEDAGGDDPIDAQRAAHSTTTDRSTSPLSMVWNACST